MNSCPDADESRRFLGSSGECGRCFVAGHAVEFFEQELPLEGSVELRTRDARHPNFFGVRGDPEQQNRSDEVSYPPEGAGGVGVSRGGHRDI